MTDTILSTTTAMSTVVTIEVAGTFADPTRRAGTQATIDRAFAWFTRVESVCSRFDPTSELRALCDRPGEAVACSELLFETLAFALKVAGETDGAFDPTVGAVMVERGFDREHRSGKATGSLNATSGVSFRDVQLDDEARTVTLLRPLLLDLGAVAKGLAVDLAARELAPLRDFVVDAGGDLYVSGQRGDGRPWSIGIRHPRERDRLVASLSARDTAICTSGDYERVSAAGHHIVEPRTGRTVDGLASVTALAPTAMVADALATAAFVLGPTAGADLLERNAVAGLFVTNDLRTTVTAGFPVDCLGLDGHDIASSAA